jgi:hypothetical protein
LSGFRKIAELAAQFTEFCANLKRKLSGYGLQTVLPPQPVVPAPPPSFDARQGVIRVLTNRTAVLTTSSTRFTIVLLRGTAISNRGSVMPRRQFRHGTKEHWIVRNS